MANSAVPRNNIVQPFSTRTPFIGKGQGHDPQSGVAWPHIKFMQSVEAGVNSSVQLAPAIPASSSSPGVAGTEIYDKATNTVYKCIASNYWIKLIGTTF